MSGFSTFRLIISFYHLHYFKAVLFVWPPDFAIDEKKNGLTLMYIQSLTLSQTVRGSG